MSRVRHVSVMVLITLVVMLFVWLILHPTGDPAVCYGFGLGGRYHYFPVPCSVWPFYGLGQ